ncbi:MULTISPECIES: hypothetical protein [Lactococcus]|uniref:Uncharacterized protein n=2 Tax=Lactococcus TaxID=1357 RepID=A0AAJ2MLF0_9LACT|nr:MULTISPECIES: hypothetical protein [Lactococcus]MDT2526411.1 hypothetical protein [Lactococcus petauri]MDT2540956.1 hypothetical protein [Lactococcus petauri]MDT2557530.1 hypothetical protein [Lactococcus petauri]MDT2559395.1 hypothetical protein [Lactococcus petauri]MDT2567968.1 hypothetical protein [Lactococcus petauri]
MGMPVEFEDGLLQNDDVFDYLQKVKAQVPEMVQDKATKTALIELKKELNAKVNEIDLAEKKQINELIDVFRTKNFKVWEVRSELAGLVKKIGEVNTAFDDRRRRESFEAIELFVNQTNNIYQLTGTRWVLTPGRFSSVDALTVQGDLKKTIKDKITNAALQAQADLEQEELLEAARKDKLEKEKQLAEKEKELKQRESDIARRETSDVQGMQKQIEQERARAQAKAQSLKNVQATYENKEAELIGRLTALENTIDIEKTYSGLSVLNMVKKIKEFLK